jgi:hypothetical protein
MTKRKKRGLDAAGRPSRRNGLRGHFPRTGQPPFSPVKSRLALTSVKIRLYASVGRRFTFGRLACRPFSSAIPATTTRKRSRCEIGSLLTAGKMKFSSTSIRSGASPPVSAGSARSIWRQIAAKRCCSWFPKLGLLRSGAAKNSIWHKPEQAAVRRADRELAGRRASGRSR